MDPLVPAIAGEYRTTLGAVGLTAAAFTLAHGDCQLFWGPVGDRFGKYRVAALACLLSAVTVGAAAFAGSLAALAGLRLLSGVTAAAVIPWSIAFIGDHVPYERRQATLASFLSGQILGLIGGQVVGGAVGDLFGWRAVFLVLAALFLVPAFLLWTELRGGNFPPPLLGATARPGQLAIAYLRLPRRRWARTALLTVLAEGLLFFGASAYVGNATQMAPEVWGLAVSTFASCFFVGQGVGAWLAGLVIAPARACCS
jgi:MFS family permease